jgi:hypothetical protein
MENLTYQTSPEVTYATNQFVDVPVILMYDETPLISIIHERALGYTTSIPIYHSDGTYLAKVNGTRIFSTSDGAKAGLAIRQTKDTTVCTLDGKSAFEIHHSSGAAFRMHAELYTPTGFFVKTVDSLPEVKTPAGEPFVFRKSFMMQGCLIKGYYVGIWVRSNGGMSIGVNKTFYDAQTATRAEKSATTLAEATLPG